MFASVALIGVILTAPIPKEAPVDPPKGIGPNLTYFKVDGDAIVTVVHVTEAVPVQKTVEVVRLVDKVAVKETVVVTEVVTRSKMIFQKVDEKTTKFKTADGNDLTYSEASGRLKNGAICAVGYVGQPVDAAYLKVLKPETVVVYLAEAKPQPNVMPPAPGGIRALPAPIPAQLPVPLRAPVPVPLPAPVPEKKG